MLFQYNKVMNMNKSFLFNNVDLDTSVTEFLLRYEKASFWLANN